MLAPLLLAAFAAAPDPAESPADAGVTVLFDGSGLDAWEKYPQGEIPAGWSIADDGSLRFSGEDGAGGNIQTREAFEDFDLRFEWKVSEGANSGVIYGVKPDPQAPPYMTGPEYQVLDDTRHRDGKNTRTSAGALYAMEEARPFKKCPVDGSARCPHVKKTLKAVGEWNTGRIVKDGDSLRHYLNGEKVVDVTIGSDAWKEAVADSKFADWADFAGPLSRGEAGRIVLQDHGDEVWFRNVTVRPPGTDDDPQVGEAAAAPTAAAPTAAAPTAAAPERVEAVEALQPLQPIDAEMPRAGDRPAADAPAETPADGGAGAPAAEPVAGTAGETADPAVPATTGADLKNGSDWAAFLKGGGN